MNFREALEKLQEGDTVVLNGSKNPQIVECLEEETIFLCPYSSPFYRKTGIVKHPYCTDFISGIYEQGKIIYRDGFEKKKVD